MNYLIRTESDQHFPSRLTLFTDEDDGFNNLTCEQKLTEYLKHLILLNHYSGLGPLIKGFWCWDENDKVAELDLEHLWDIPEMDSIDQEYRVMVKQTGKEITRFTVRI
jgi:hypothetical protein